MGNPSVAVSPDQWWEIWQNKEKIIQQPKNKTKKKIIKLLIKNNLCWWNEDRQKMKKVPIKQEQHLFYDEKILQVWL